ncbi:hypothetical protein [Enterococcus sp. AZ194]|uniref:hypothetical protein n=1 Tax=Enterococcus sp. AZ194 TaxID=2774629 RepID=UPI003F6858F9
MIVFVVPFVLYFISMILIILAMSKGISLLLYSSVSLLIGDIILFFFIAYTFFYYV